MPLFIIDPQSDFVKPYLTKEDEHHLTRVLRAKAGDQVLLTDNHGHIAQARIVQNLKTDKNLTFKIEKKEFINPPPKITACLPLLHDHSRLEWAVEKLCELNVQDIQLMHTERCQKKSLSEKSWLRLKKVALATQKQCDRPWPLSILATKELREILLNRESSFFYGDLPNRISQSTLIKKRDFHKFLIVGPEGDLTDDEYLTLKNHGAQGVSLGNNVLRAETALLVLTLKCNEI